VSDFLARSIPNSFTEPLTILALAGSRRTSDSAVVVLPQPDSPAIPNASPSFSRKLTSLTAWTVAFGSRKCVVRCSTSRSGAAGSASLGRGHWRRPATRAAAPMRIGGSSGGGPATVIDASGGAG
jgi:hypothetical protein